MAVLTDGREWSFYLPGEQGNYDERRFYKLDLVDRDTLESKQRLVRYLSYERVLDGSARSAAQDDYRKAANHRVAVEAVPKAWNEILSEPDEFLIELIAERAEGLCGFRPDAEEVEKFLVTILRNEATVEPVISRKAKITIDIANIRAAGGREIDFTVFGVRKSAKSAKEAMVTILRELASKRSDFWEQLALRARSRKRNHLARTREDVYPGRLDLAASTMEIVPGWWIGLNIANREKDRILRAACDAANVKYGKDVVIQFPNLE